MASSDNRYDFWINNLGFNTYITKDHPYERSTADYRKEQFNSAAGTGDTALTGWWTQGQLSFHGGEALRYDSEWTPITDIRFDTGSNLDCYTAGYAKVGLATAAVTTLHTTYNSMSVMPSAGLLVARGPAGTLDVIDQGGTGTDNKTFTEFPAAGSGYTATTHPGIAGDATAYIVTDNTIERCWNRNPPAPLIRQWCTDPALAGNSVIVPCLTGANATFQKTGVSGGVSASAAVFLNAQAPTATVVHNLALNPSFSSPGNNTPVWWNAMQGGGFISSPFMTTLTSTITSVSATPPVSTTCAFQETVSPSASVPFVFSSVITLPVAGNGVTTYAFKGQIAYNDTTPITATASVTWDVGGTTGVSISPTSTWSLFDASGTIPNGATSGSLNISIQPSSTTHVGGKGVYLTDILFSTDTTSFFSGLYPPTGMAASWMGGTPAYMSIASKIDVDRPVMVTLRVSGTPAITLAPYATNLPLPTTAYQSWTAGGVTTVALPLQSSSGLVSLKITGITALSIVSVTDVLKPAVTDTTTALPTANWSWDGATNLSTQTYTGTYVSEPLAWLPTTTTPTTGSFAPVFVGAWWAKGRLIALDNNGNWYQSSPSSRHILGTADIFWTVPIEIANMSIPWSIHEGPDGIYITHDHRVWLASLDTTSTSAPTVAQVAAVANDEIIKDFAYYLGQLITVTDKGIRSGRLNLYGRLIIGPRFALGSYTACTPWDDTVLVSGTESVTGVSGVFAVSMVVDVDQNTTIPAWWNVWQGTPPASLGASVGSPSASWNPDGGFTTRPSFNAPVVLSATGTVNTFAANSATSGSLTTTRIRMGTLENKVFRYLTVRTAGTSGTVAVSVILPNGTTITLGSVTAGNIGTWDLQAQSGFPAQGCEYVQFQFTISGAASLTGWQIKAQPNPTRQRMIKVPLQLFDTETSIYGATSYQSAAKRLLQLEALENSNAVVTYKDTTTGDSGTAYIESIQVVRLAPASAQANGGTPSFGGTIELTLRKA